MEEVNLKPGMREGENGAPKQPTQEEQMAAARVHFVELITFCRQCVDAAPIDASLKGDYARELFHHLLENERIQFNSDRQREFLKAQAEMQRQQILTIPPGAKLRRN